MPETIDSATPPDATTVPEPGLLEEVRRTTRNYQALVKRLEAAQRERDEAWQAAWDGGWSFGRIGEAGKTPPRTVQWTLRQKWKRSAGAQ